MSLLADLRRGRYAELAFVAATLVGVAAASVHWVGLVVGGVLVGVLSASVSRALVQGLTFGGVVLAVQLGLVWWGSDLDAWFSTGVLLALTVAMGLGLPAVAAVGARAATGSGESARER